MTRFLSTLLLAFTFNVHSQSALSITLEECEQIFLRQNASLLAEQYNIDAKSAQIIQSKLYPNPTLSGDINLFDPQHKRFLHIDSSGQKAFAIEQVILLGGKRRTEIDIAKTNKALAEIEYTDLLRSLRFQLHHTYFTISSTSRVLASYDRQLNILDTIIASYQRQTEKGNLPLKDLIRLKAIYMKINSNGTELHAQLNEAQKRLKLLLHSRDDVEPRTSDDDFTRFLADKSLADLQTAALSNSPDVKFAEVSNSLSGLMLEREKRQRVPDLHLNGSYDQRGGAFINQVNIGAAITLPVFNNNRGSIKAAEFELKSKELYAAEKRLEVELSLQEAFSNLQRTAAEYRRATEMYNEGFVDVFNGINENFHRRNVTILEFVDFVESYNESLSNFEKMKQKLADYAATINFITASKIY